MYIQKERNFSEVPQLSARDVAYQNDDASLRPFYRHAPEISSFKEAINIRSKAPVDRPLLNREIANQYSKFNAAPEVVKNIDKLKDQNTFTVTTAHQPVLLTGPLYFIYKIAGTIKLCQQLSDTYPAYNFVPVFILGGEDHDFDEIASCHLFNKTFTWETRQKGAVGRMSIDDLKPLLGDIVERFGTSPFASNLKKMINEAYDQAENYGEFIFSLVNSLFGRFGLVTINTDNEAFKRSFLPVVIRDLQELISQKMVNKDQKALENTGFKPQAFARQVNLFYHMEDRERIMMTDNGKYQIGERSMDLKTLIQLLHDHPGNISPNVVLRPLYQEFILPNLAYVGGGGELAYWMERVSLFEEMKIPFPILIRRDSFLIVDKRSMSNLDQMNLSLDRLFDREERIINQYALNQASTEINLDDPKQRLRNIFQEIADLAKEVDPTLYKSVLGESAKAEKILEYLESKLLKAEKRKRSTELQKISRLKNKFFPNNDGLQERYENFIPYYLRYGPKWIDSIIDHANPLNKAFKILIEVDS